LIAGLPATGAEQQLVGFVVQDFAPSVHDFGTRTRVYSKT
jgi:hypothetical protein